MSFLIEGLPESATEGKNPPIIFLEFLAEFLSNNAFIAGIHLSEDKKTAELVTCSVCDGAMLSHDLHFAGMSEITKVAFCRLGLKQENVVNIYKDKIVFKMKKGFLQLGNILQYLQEHSIKPSEHFIEIEKSGKFEILTFLFKETQGLDLMEYSDYLGFSGQYYDIPYISIDPKQGYFHTYEMMDKTFKNLIKRTEKFYTQAQSSFASSPIDEQCIEHMKLKINQFNKYSSLDNFGDYFSEKRNSTYFEVFSLNKCQKHTSIKAKIMELCHKSRKLSDDNKNTSRSKKGDYNVDRLLQKKMLNGKVLNCINQFENKPQNNLSTGCNILTRLCQSSLKVHEKKKEFEIDSIMALFLKEQCNSHHQKFIDELKMKGEIEATTKNELDKQCDGGYDEKLEKNKIKAKERLNGKDVDFRNLESEEVERLKLELKKAKKREKQAIVNKKKRQLRRQRKRKEEKEEKKVTKNKNSCY